MGKYDFIKTKNIVPVHKILTLKYEESVGSNYSGEIKEIIIRVYPYEVEEKLELQNLIKEISDLTDKKDEESIKKVTHYAEEMAFKSAYYVLKKDDPEIEEETVKKMSQWYDDIMIKALEFEGFTEEEIRQKGKKEINKLLE